MLAAYSLPPVGLVAHRNHSHLQSAAREVEEIVVAVLSIHAEVRGGGEVESVLAVDWDIRHVACSRWLQFLGRGFAGQLDVNE